jgi:site-specific recombinase XerC
MKPHLIKPKVASSIYGRPYFPPVLIGWDGMPVDAVNAWFRYLLCGQHRELTTVLNYAYRLMSFWNFLDSYPLGAPERDWRRMTNSTVRTWRGHMMNSGVHVNSVLYNRNRLFEFYEWASPRGLVDCEVVAPGSDAFIHGALCRDEVGVEMEHIPPLPIPSFKDITAVLATIAAHSSSSTRARDQLILRWASEVGLRNSELRSLTIFALPTLGTILGWELDGTTPTMTVKGKGKKTRVVEPPSSLLKDTLAFCDICVRDGLRDTWRSLGGHVFHSPKLSSLSQTYVSARMSNYFKIAGLDSHLHRARAYYAYMLVLLKVQELSKVGRIEELQVSTILRFVADRVGHVNLKTLRYYVNIAVMSLQAKEPQILPS